MNILDKIFGKSESEIHFDKKNPIENSSLKRNESFYKSFDLWKKTLRFSEIKNDLKEKMNVAYMNKGAYSMNIFYESDGFSGFHLDVRKMFETDEEAAFLLEFLKEKTKMLGYRTQYSNLKIYTKINDIIKEETYYIKPQITSFEAPVNQAYGNIRYVMEYRNEKPENLKIELTVYTGFNYQKAASINNFFEDLWS